MRLKLITAIIFLSTSIVSSAQMDDVVITVNKVTDSIYMLQGRGGNIGVSVGDDGVFMVDDQFAPLTDKILEAIETISDRQVKFVVNTHWHGDHTGGNENLGNQGSMIVAHKNVRKRMSTKQVIKAFGQQVEAAPPAALPVITFDRHMTFYFNDEQIEVIHIPRGHTDGDSILHFATSNVIHTGDLVFNGVYPFIDSGSGGSFDGVIAAANKIIEMSDENTKIIPGHGPIASREDIITYRNMLTKVRSKIIGLLNDKKTLAAVEIEDPLEEFNDKWGKGFMKPDVWLRIVYQDLVNQ